MKKEYFVLDSEYLTTQLVVVPKYVLKYSPFLFIKKNNTVVMRNLFIFISQATYSLSYMADLAYLRNTWHESSKIFVEHESDFVRKQFQNQA